MSAISQKTRSYTAPVTYETLALQTVICFKPKIENNYFDRIFCLIEVCGLLSKLFSVRMKKFVFSSCDSILHTVL